MATYETALDRSIKISETEIAYRIIGPTHGIPLVIAVYFRGTMDHWDPALINRLAAQRPVILLDSPGVGQSGGEVPETIAGFAQVYIDVVKALGFSQIDMMGFSFGGAVAQMVALNAPDLVRRLILCGTTPSIGPNVMPGDSAVFGKLVEATTLQQYCDAFLSGFFPPSDHAQATGEDVWERIAGSRPHGLTLVDGSVAGKQAAAFSRFMSPGSAEQGSYNRLHELRVPVLVLSGSNDILMPTDNSILLWRKLTNAARHLHLYPDSGHGFLFQYAEQVALLINNFLSAN
ncbi:Alpha/Beta hydrolase protein [Dactylonectria estremocensis]|uniref:Alpha/Beta hydrolase protein n=1 Tax=Dactylonectria estremocensis TaxID=1079267 RepID=A0A9P9J723_9HYPO|nr:Alpha/Beta hydrolase protein [Dactylonectria estremocensis]